MKTLSISTLLFITACATSPVTTSSAQRAIIDSPCAADTDCPTGFECELEHGTSFCQASEPSDDGSANGGCPDGYELEVEEGQDFCKVDDGSGSDDGSNTGSGACATSADCPAGLECEVETATCKAHGGH